MVINLDVFHARELFEVGAQRLDDAVRSAIRNAYAGEINAHDRGVFGQFEFAVAGEAVVNRDKASLFFGFAGAFEERIEHRPHLIIGRRNKTFHCLF